MKFSRSLLGHTLMMGFAIAVLFSITKTNAQEAGAASPAPATKVAVPRLIQFNSTLKDSRSKPLEGVVPVTFTIYAGQEYNTPLWTETQDVTPGADGSYTVLLGAASPDGIPPELFAKGEARWLGVRTDEQPESPRVLLVSVPYALKAADADTLGGLPPSAFLTGLPPNAAAAGSSVTGASLLAAPGITLSPAFTGSGTTNYIPLWTSSTNIGNSILSQSSGNVQVNGGLVLPSTGTSTATAGYTSRPLDLFASAFSSSAQTPIVQHFRWQVEPVGNNTSSAASRIGLLYSPGTGTPAETGFSFSNKGILTFAAGQTFPGVGTIKGVTAGTDLTGGGASGVVTLNLDTTKVPQLKTANTFTGNQSVTGNLTATGAASLASLLVSGLGTFNGGVNVAGSHGLYANGSADTDGNYGVFGHAAGSTKKTYGVYGQTRSLNGAGVYGSLVGLSNSGSAYGNKAGVWGDTNQASAIAVLGTADDAYGAVLNNNSGFPTLYAHNASSAGTLLEVLSPGGFCEVDGVGNLECSGSKSAVVPVERGTRKVALYAVEAPENWFEDAGSGQLLNGAVKLELEPIFAQTVNTGIEYHVFLTPKGDCKGLYVTNEMAQSFEVHELGGGRSNIAFDYRVMARRKGYETVRLADRTKHVATMKSRQALLRTGAQKLNERSK